MLGFDGIRLVDTTQDSDGSSILTFEVPSGFRDACREVFGENFEDKMSIIIEEYINSLMNEVEHTILTADQASNM